MWRVSYVLEISRQTERSVCHPLPVASQDPKRKRRKKTAMEALGFVLQEILVGGCMPLPPLSRSMTHSTLTSKPKWKRMRRGSREGETRGN